MRGWLLLGMTALATAAAAAPAMRSLGKGPHSGVTQPGQRVIRTAEAWQKLWDEHTANVQPKPPLPAVDFNKEMVLAVFMGQRPTLGYATDVTAVTREKKGLRVTVRESSPPPGALTGQLVTSPYAFVAVPRSDGPVKFVVIGGDRSR